MCDPTLFAIAGTLLVGGSQVAAGMAANQAGRANALTLQRLADQARERGEADVAESRRQTAAFKGEQAAAFGASGGEINTGSSLQILADTAEFGELNALRIRNNAEREAFAFESGAAISLAEGSNAQIVANLGAAGTLLTGGAEVASRWKVFKKTNTGGTFTDFLLGRDPIPATVPKRSRANIFG